MFMHPAPPQTDGDGSSPSFEFSGQRVELAGLKSCGLFEGWRAEFLFSGLSPILVLQLVHSTGDRAVWYLGADGSRRAGAVEELDDDAKAMLRHRVAAILGPSLQATMEDPQPVVEPVAQGFLKLDLTAKTDLMRLAADRLPGSPGVQLIDEAPHAIPIIDSQASRQALIERRHVMSALTQDFQGSLTAAVRAGRAAFSIPSPVTGEAIDVQASLCFGDFHFAYRFVEPRNGLVFYLIAGYELSHCYGMYFPQCQTIFCRPGQLALSRLAAAHLPGWLADHFISFGGEFADYVARPLAKMASMLRAPPWTHIGHQLWNELTGIDRLLQETALNGAIEWTVPDGDAPIEFYGAVDELFPPLRGNVRRGFRDVAHEMRFIYDNNRLAVRITRDFVSAGLRDRLLGFATSSAPMVARREHAALDCGRPVILLGLRVENRTLVNLTAFYARLVAAIQSAFPATCFLIDGHNVADSKGYKYKSHGEQIGDTTAVVETERSIVRELTAQFGTSTVVSAIGLTVSENLQLINRCCFFVSLWGAGLAKYRWICNKPGFVLTNSWNLLQRSDLRIYDHPHFLENPSPIHWVDPALVMDHPDAPRVVAAGHHPQWSNFALQEAPVVESILQALGGHICKRGL